MAGFNIFDSIREAAEAYDDPKVRKMWADATEQLKNRFAYKVDSTALTAKALHQLQQGEAPHIVIVGPTSAGKTSLANRLFGSTVGEVSIRANTTRSIRRVGFPSGLVIYDTPGILGGETTDTVNYENVTRAFLGITQVKKRGGFLGMQNAWKLDSAWLVQDDQPESDAIEIPVDKLRKQEPIDIVLCMVDISTPLLGNTKTETKEFISELQSKYKGKCVIAGTKVDILREQHPYDLKGMLNDFEVVLGDDFLPVSSSTGEGIQDLVLTLFRTLPDAASPIKLQESLTTVSKLDRLSFILHQSSTQLASIVKHTGREATDIQFETIFLFALLCNHYSVSEDEWRKYNGDAIKIAEAVGREGVVKQRVSRPPAGVIEKVQSWFGIKFFDEATSYRQLGMAGLEDLIPQVYTAIFAFEGMSGTPRSEADIRTHVESLSKELEPLIKQGDTQTIAIPVEQLLRALLPGQTATAPQNVSVQAHRRPS